MHLVLDLVADDGSLDHDAGFLAGGGVESVAVVPLGEGTADLAVAEVFVPDELGDLGLPGDADGGVRKGFEAEGHARAGAGGDAVEAHGRVGCDGAGWRRSEGCLLDAGLLPAGYEAGQVFGVGEEGED